MTALPAKRRVLATAYRLALHDAQCGRGACCPDREGCSWMWVQHQPVGAWLAAVAHLEARPRDTKGARGILHDAICCSGCTGVRRDEHAMTQAVSVRVLRKVLAERPMMLACELIEE